MDAKESPKRRKRANLRRRKVTELRNLCPGDVVQAYFDGGWVLVVETSNGVRIVHRDAIIPKDSSQ